jgi:hypothetical protein
MSLADGKLLERKLRGNPLSNAGHRACLNASEEEHGLVDEVAE